jgi:hypothetical protein
MIDVRDLRSSVCRGPSTPKLGRLGMAQRPWPSSDGIMVEQSWIALADEVTDGLLVVSRKSEVLPFG